MPELHAVLQALLVDRDERLGEPLELLLVVDLEVIIGAVGSRPDAEHADLHQLADLEALHDLFERRLAQGRIDVARPAHLELRVGPDVDVARRDRHPELLEVAVLRLLDRRRIEVAVERLLEHALVDLDRVYAGRLGAAALRLEAVAERGVVRVIPGRREAVVEVTRRPVADAVLDVHRLHELDRLVPAHVGLLRRGEGELIGSETAHSSSSRRVMLLQGRGCLAELACHKCKRYHPAAGLCKRLHPALHHLTTAPDGVRPRSTETGGGAA